MKWKKLQLRHLLSVFSILKFLNRKRTTNMDSENTTTLSYGLLSFSLEKQQGLGEDTVLTIVEKNQIGVIAVFDGLGGAGGTKYEIGGKAKTGAYLASRIAAKSFANLIYMQEGENFNIRDIGKELKSSLFKDFSRYVNRYIGSKTSLKGGIVQRLPTTLAAWVICFENGGSGNKIKALWAGDSRCYIFHPVAGLRQVSQDDLLNDINPLHNIKMDSPLSNFITSDNDFVINEKDTVFNNNLPLSPEIYFVATDGVFNYYPTPMHFEYMLLATMQVSIDSHDWENNIKNDVRAITADDASLAGIIFNYNTFEDVQLSFKKRHDEVKKKYIEPINNLRNEIIKKRKEMEGLSSKTEKTENDLWDNYQKKYSLYEDEL